MARGRPCGWDHVSRPHPPLRGRVDAHHRIPTLSAAPLLHCDTKGALRSHGASADWHRLQPAKPLAVECRMKPFSPSPWVRTLTDCSVASPAACSCCSAAALIRCSAGRGAKSIFIDSDTMRFDKAADHPASSPCSLLPACWGLGIFPAAGADRLS